MRTRPSVLDIETQGSQAPGRLGVGHENGLDVPPRETKMNHTANTSDSDGSSESPKIASLANPRRTRLGADGRPIAAGPVTTTGD